eukprot:contig_6239_g1416
MSKEQEQVLVGVAEAFSVNNLPLSRLQLKALVNNRFGATVSREWMNRWLARHRGKLSLRACKTLADKRAKPQVREALSFGDQLGAHTQAQVIEQCMLRAVFLFFLTLNSSPINQPLDAYLLASLKGHTTWTNEQGIMDCVLSSTNARDSLLLAAYTAEVMAFTSDATVGSFRLCGLWPFSPATMLQRAKDILGMAAENASAREVAQSAAAAVISEATQRNTRSHKGTSTGPASVQRSVLHSGAPLTSQAYARQAARVKLKEEKCKAFTPNPMPHT